MALGLIRPVLSRLGQSVFVLLAMSFIVYGLMGVMPGDPIDLMIAGDPRLTAEDAIRLKAVYGLDRPWTERWLRWLAQAIQGEFGYSRLYAQPVAETMAPALVNTALLMISALSISLAVALPLGVWAARRPGSPVDMLVNLLAFASVSVPVFWLGLMLIVLFAVSLGWLPAGGLRTVGGPDSLNDRLIHLALPVATLALVGLGQFARHMRAAMIAQAGSDYIRTARAKGCSPVRVLVRHQLRNALLPVVTIVALEIGGLFSGALVTETVFAWPGMGRLIYASVMGNDFNLALSGLLLATAMTLVGSILADLAYWQLDPRVRGR
ncbi:ABC transporter permease [Magnetospirillum molischianum]|uniref:ABC-type dipeptide/oligopeptide/nickel transport systems n=1 Tax=Magnetospirillum molischianum DSM 120 TaxID=1150626 RepID=H8FWZ0_MAGML|nr:ABC transporter permease [Magnetospirillum molischianum]CCG42878.1 ABC-type dipeptide/oligopeptide/nickel transport systems [Magnetospirillum molischianum DSM 120]